MPQTNKSKTPAKSRKYEGRKLPAAKRGAIIVSAIQGKSHTQIAKEQDCNRKTVARLLSAPEIQVVLNQTESQLHQLLPLAVETYKAHLEEHNSQVATNLFVGLQVFKPKSQHHVTHSTPLEDELARRGLAGRSIEELRYFCLHGYFQEEEEKFGGVKLGEGLPN